MKRKRPTAHERRIAEAAKLLHDSAVVKRYQKLLKEITAENEKRVAAMASPQYTAVDPYEGMTPFERSVSISQSNIKNLLITKGREYVRGDNRYHNFDRTAAMNRESAARSLHGFLSKHITNYLDMLDDIDNGKTFTVAQINERFGDILVYFHIQQALFLDRHVKPDTIGATGC